MKSLLILLSLFVALDANAQNWTRTAGPVEDDVFDLCIDSNGILYAVTPLGVNRSTDGGEHWTRPFVFPLASDNGRIFIAPNGSIIASSSSGMFVSYNRGDTFDTLMKFSGTDHITDFAISGNGRIFAGHTTWLKYSDDNGITWTSTVPTYRPVRITASHDTVLMHDQSAVYYSTTNGKLWDLRESFSGADIRRLMILPNGLWVCLSKNACLLYYNNKTKAWNKFAGTPGIAPCYAADVMRDGSILLSWANGVYLVKNTSQWTNLRPGFLNQVTRFIEDPVLKIHYAATKGAGVWKSRTMLNVNTELALPSLHVSPNPAQDRVTIEYTAFEPKPVTIKLYDMLGRVLWKRTENAATVQNVVNFDAQSLLPGCYLIVLEISGEVKTHWVTIL